MPKTLADLAKMFDGVQARLNQNIAAAVKTAADESANRARREHSYHDRSGVLTNSIDAEGPMGNIVSGNVEAIVSAGAPYAEYIEAGTPPHKIRPRHRRALRFPKGGGGGGWQFARVVNHPGTKPTRFLSAAVEKELPRLEQELIPDAVELSFIQAGFTGE